jgi:uncharacterized protein YqeY
MAADATLSEHPGNLIEALLAAAIATTGAAGPQDMGKVMAILKGKLAGRADLTAVSAMVKSRLAAR